MREEVENMAGRKIETPDEYLGAERSFHIDEIGDKQEIEVIDRVIKQDAIDMEAFMHEKLTVMVHESTDPNDAEIVHIAVNGVRQFFHRGTPQVVRRCFVERLARAKRTAYTQNLDERLGESVVNRMTPRHALRYPFSVIEDANPKGSAWLRNLLAERQ